MTHHYEALARGVHIVVGMRNRSLVLLCLKERSTGEHLKRRSCPYPRGHNLSTLGA